MSSKGIVREAGGVAQGRGVGGKKSNKRKKLGAEIKLGGKCGRNKVQDARGCMRMKEQNQKARSN